MWYLFFQCLSQDNSPVGYSAVLNGATEVPAIFSKIVFHPVQCDRSACPPLLLNWPHPDGPDGFEPRYIFADPLSDPDSHALNAAIKSFDGCIIRPVYFSVAGMVQVNFSTAEPISKRFSLAEVKAGENFNRRNTRSISRIEI
jgi:hypothetical protein